VEITAALAADLAILSETLSDTDADTDADIGARLRRLAADAKLAVPSYLGLTVLVGSPTSAMTLTAMEEFAHPDDVVSSVLIPLADDALDCPGFQLVVILYAGAPGAFVDLGADLSWLTGRRLTDFALDQHLNLSSEPDAAGGVHVASVVNQAIGVLIGRGYTPEQAELEIDAQAAAAGHSRSDAANIVLQAPPRGDVDPTRGVR
jgi:hypothetical protein